jgi:hypothetical protein
VHVTFRARKIGGSLRQERVLKLLKAALGRLALVANGFQVVHYSVQHDHVHLIVEAGARGDIVEAERRLRRGIAGLAVSLAKRLNGMLKRRGSVWGDRHHRRDLETPAEVRRTLLYVLKNAAHHGLMRADRLDPFSTSFAFDGWAARVVKAETEPWARRPRTWLLALGWLRAGGRLRPTETPRLAL